MLSLLVALSFLPTMQEPLDIRLNLRVGQVLIYSVTSKEKAGRPGAELDESDISKSGKVSMTVTAKQGDNYIIKVKNLDWIEEYADGYREEILDEEYSVIVSPRGHVLKISSQVDLDIIAMRAGLIHLFPHDTSTGGGDWSELFSNRLPMKLVFRPLETRRIQGRQVLMIKVSQKDVESSNTYVESTIACDLKSGITVLAEMHAGFNNEGVHHIVTRTFQLENR